ncbi:MAG: AtpZ/AtpI family protein [Chitinophagales bacterium]
MFDNYLKFSAIGFQMVAVVLIGFGIGWYIDSKLNTDKPYAALAFTLIFVFIAMYLVIKELQSMNNKND